MHSVFIWGTGKFCGVSEDGRDDTSGSISRRCDNSPAASIFLIDGEGVKANPIQDGERVIDEAFIALEKLLVESVGTALDFESTWKCASVCYAILYAFLHCIPNVMEFLARFLLGPDGIFICQH